MFRKQLMGFAGAMAAFATLALVWIERQVFFGLGPASDDAQARLAYALIWLLLPALLIARRLSWHASASRRCGQQN